MFLLEILKNISWVTKILTTIYSLKNNNNGAHMISSHLNFCIRRWDHFSVFFFQLLTKKEFNSTWTILSKPHTKGHNLIKRPLIISIILLS